MYGYVPYLTKKRVVISRIYSVIASFSQCVIHIHMHVICVHHTCVGTGHILEKVVLHFPKIMCILLYMRIILFYVLHTYMFYTFTYRGVCIIFMYINYWMYVTHNVMACMMWRLARKHLIGRPVFKIFKIFVKL